LSRYTGFYLSRGEGLLSAVISKGGRNTLILQPRLWSDQLVLRSCEEIKIVTDLAGQAKQYWSAAYFFRRAPERHQANARKVIQHLSLFGWRGIKIRATAVAKEMEHSSQSIIEPSN